MNKCFITKLPSSVDNDNLPVLGQLRIKWLKQNDLTDNASRGFVLSTNNSITVKVSGAHFTDSTLTSNEGNIKTITATNGLVRLYVSNDADAILTIDNKYSLTSLSFVVQAGKEFIKRSVFFDIEDIEYCTNLTSLGLSNTQVSGDISAVSQLTGLINLGLLNTQVSGDISAISKLTNLTLLSLDNTQVSGDISAVSKLTNLTSLGLPSIQVSGDISAVSKLTNLTSLNLHSTQVSGDISAVSKLTNLTSLGLPSTQVSGDISAVSKLTNLTSLGLSSTQVSGDISAVSKLTKLTSLGLNSTQVSGDISAISKLTNLTYLGLDSTQVSGDIDNLAGLTKIDSLPYFKNLALTGDMSKIPTNVRFISQSSRKINTNFTWTAKGRQNATLLAMEGPVPFDTVSMDNMLIDQATCTLKAQNTSNEKVISVNGTRTSASDAAVTAIQNMGVTIIGVIKQA